MQTRKLNHERSCCQVQLDMFEPQNASSTQALESWLFTEHAVRFLEGDACAITGLEKLVERHPNVALLIILADVQDPVTAIAAAQAQRMLNTLKPVNAQMAIDQFSAVMEQALATVAPQEEIQQQQQQELLTVATTNHVFYVSERLLMDSDVIMDLVCAGSLEVWRAVVHGDGSVDFLGIHQDLQRLVDQRERAKKHKRKGIGLGK